MLPMPLSLGIGIILGAMHSVFEPAQVCKHLQTLAMPLGVSVPLQWVAPPRPCCNERSTTDS